MKVTLNYAGIPWLSYLAVHYWFVVDVDDTEERWEVWRKQNSGGISRGYLHRNLKNPSENLGGSQTQVAQVWTGDVAKVIAAALELSWEGYPYLDIYHYVPGPNSNTYVAWVLKQAKVGFSIRWRGLGRGYPYRR